MYIYEHALSFVGSICWYVCMVISEAELIGTCQSKPKITDMWSNNTKSLQFVM